MSSLAAKTSNASAEWYTPPWLAKVARECMGSIDLDPASCHQANVLVKANQIYDYVDDGLTQEWSGNVFLNPPSRCGPDLPVCRNRKVCSCGLTEQFLHYAFEQFYDGDVDNLFYVGFNLEQLKYLADVQCNPDHVRIGIFRKRFAYYNSTLYPGKSPPHNSFVMLLSLGLRERTKFDSIIGELGRIHCIL